MIELHMHAPTHIISAKAGSVPHLARAANGSWNTDIYTLWRDLAIQLPLTAVTGPSWW